LAAAPAPRGAAAFTACLKKGEYMHPFRTSCGALLAALLALPAIAGALAPAVPATPPERAQPAAPAQFPAAPAWASADGFGQAASAELLERARGGSDSTSIVTTLNGTVGNNSATNVSSGDNVIQSGSFANLSGIPIVIQNSGANVLIQNATMINLQLK